MSIGKFVLGTLKVIIVAFSAAASFYYLQSWWSHPLHDTIWVIFGLLVYGPAVVLCAAPSVLIVYEIPLD